MFKLLIAIILLAVIVALTPSQSHELVHALVAGHDWIAEKLKDVFSGGTTGNLLRDVIASLCIPFFVGLIPAALYALAKRHWFPYFMNVVWVVWLVQTAALLMEYKLPSS